MNEYKTMKKRYINGLGWDWLEEYTSKHIHIDDKISGHIAYVRADKVKYKLTVDYDKSGTCLLDDGYKGIQFLPDYEKWCVSAVYNTKNEIVEWYFDMTKENSLDEEGNPFYLDLYLDIAVSPDFRITILDEDELMEALNNKIITKSDYNLAHNTCNMLIKNIISDKSFMIDFLKKYLIELE